MKTDNERYYVRKAHLVWNFIDDDMVIIDPDNGFVHLLNKTGAYIFELLECYMSKNELYEKIQRKCALSSDVMKTVKGDIDNYLDELEENKIINEVML